MNSRTINFFKGFRIAIPIVLGYLPVAFAFGVLSAKAGLTPLETTAMSVLVYAGSAQLIAVNLIMAGVSPLSIIATTLIVNARHALMSAALTPFLQRWNKLRQTLYCATLTDETFAVNISLFAEGRLGPASAFGVHFISYASWISGSLAGVLFGDVIGDIKPYGIDFALAGMFIGLLVPHLKISRHLWAAIFAGLIAVILYLAGVGSWAIIIATLTATTLAMFIPLKK